MGLPDVHEDAATFAAEALLRLIQDYGSILKKFQEFIWVQKVLGCSKTNRFLCNADG
jgi:hypothetical protein